MKSKYGDELYTYCKKECIRRRDGNCSGLRLRDDKMFDVIQHNPIISKIAGIDHAIHPPCSYYINNRDKLMDADGFVKEPIQIRKRKSAKPKPKRKTCSCRKK